MLVLTRRPNESIIIANNIKITVVSVGPGRVKLGIEAPANVRVDRQEIHDKIEQSTDVLSALVGGEPAVNAENTLVGAGPDTAMIVSAPADANAPASNAPATPAGTSATGNGAPTQPPLPLNKLSKYRLPRKPR
jgi:carbon storage regulator